MDLIQEFITNLYYECDILALTGVNCFDYENGRVNPEEVIKAINDNDLKVTLKYDF